MKYLILIFGILVSLSLSAQDCTPELLLQKPGTWKAGQQGSIHGVSAADLAAEKAVLAAIHKLVNTNYHPKGCQVVYSTSYGKYPNAGDVWIADPYNYTMYILPFLCDNKSADKSKYTVAISSATNVTITVNEISSLNTLFAATTQADDYRGYLKLKQRPQKKDGYFYMGEEIVGDSQEENKTVEYRWLITYGDTLPFSYINRREYLQIQQKRLEKSIKESPGQKGYFQKYLDNISDYLTKPDSELSKDAIGMWNDEERFNGFVNEGTKGSFIAVKPNTEYYNKKLPKSSSQFFTVIYKLTQNDPVFEANISAIKEALDFAKLKNMLGK
ncbi:MAG: hypothetical protein WCH34_18680 [Bacteroidota bacterium]